MTGKHTSNSIHHSRPGRPAAGSTASDNGRQKTASNNLPASKPQKRGLPILEIVLVLLIIKISAGAWYFMAGRDNAEKAALTPPAGITAVTSAANESVPASQSSKVDSYLAAAAEVMAPAVAQAAMPEQAAFSAAPAAAVSATGANSMAAGAYMVLGGQAGGEASRVETIPLPPGQDDLRAPAAQLPSSARPQTSGAAVPGLPPEPSASAGTSQGVREREQALARREALLATREEALKTLEADLDRRWAAMEAAKTEMESSRRRNEAIVEEMKALRDEQEKEESVLADARLQHLVAAYKGMKPDQAGNLINSMDDDVAVAILSAMPGRPAGLILANVDPEKAARLTKAISERRIDPNLLLSENPPVQ